MSENIYVARSDTASVSIRASVDVVWQLLSVVEDWVIFSPFALEVRSLDSHYAIRGPQGWVELHTRFASEHGLLDHEIIFQTGEAVTIPYRVVANAKGSELIMTNFQARGDSEADYLDQVAWMRDELAGAKQFVEERRIV